MKLPSVKVPKVTLPKKLPALPLKKAQGTSVKREKGPSKFKVPSQLSLKMNLKAKLALAFGLMIAIIAILGVFSVFNMSMINKRSAEISGDILPGINASYSLNKMASDFRVLEFRHILAKTKNEKMPIERDLQNLDTAINKTLEKYGERVANDEDKRLYDSAVQDWHMYITKHNAAMQLSSQLMNDQAVTMMNASKIEFDRVASTLLKLVAYNTGLAKEKADEGANAYQTSFIILVILVILSSIIGLVVLLVTTRGIIRPINQLKTNLDDLVEKGGDLTQTIDIHSGDEIELLAKSFNQFIKNLRDIIAQVVENSHEIHNMGDNRRDFCHNR